LPANFSAFAIDHFRSAPKAAAAPWSQMCDTADDLDVYGARRLLDGACYEGNRIPLPAL